MTQRRPEIRAAIIGAGVAGRVHAYGYRLAGRRPEGPGAQVRLVAVADENVEQARRLAAEYGVERVARSWEEVASAKDIDAVSVAVANDAHFEIVDGLLASGKHVLCEKPLTPSSVEARALVAAAERAGVVDAVGFVYRFAPAIAAIREAVDAGRLGDARMLHGRFWTDWAVDPEVPFSWRFGRRGGGGAVVDLGSHIIDMARLLFGDVERIAGADLETFVHERPDQDGSESMRPVENEDAGLFLVRFENGAFGEFSVSRVATGHRNSLGFTAIFSGGSAAFDWERVGEFQYYEHRRGDAMNGARRVVVGERHPLGHQLPYPAAGVGYGIADCFGFQARAFIDSIHSERSPHLASFRDGLEAALVCEGVVDVATAAVGNGTTGKR